MKCFQNGRRIPTKEVMGKILMITGSKGMSGAAYLSAKSAYISGGGLVQIYTEETNRVDSAAAFAGSDCVHVYRI